MKITYKNKTILKLIQVKYGHIKGLDAKYKFIIRDSELTSKEHLIILRYFLDSCLNELASGVEGDDIDIK